MPAPLRIPATALAAVCAALLTGCGGSSSHTVTRAAYLTHGGGGAVQIVVSAEGVAHIGLQTAAVSGAPDHRPASGGGSPATPSLRTIPYGALVYEADGRPLVYVVVRHGVYAPQPVGVDHIDGSRVYINSGPPAGARIVSVGAEELLGVQHGVGAES